MEHFVSLKFTSGLFPGGKATTSHIPGPDADKPQA